MSYYGEPYNQQQTAPPSNDGYNWEMMENPAPVEQMNILQDPKVEIERGLTVIIHTMEKFSELSFCKNAVKFGGLEQISPQARPTVETIGRQLVDIQPDGQYLSIGDVLKLTPAVEALVSIHHALTDMDRVYQHNHNEHIKANRAYANTNEYGDATAFVSPWLHTEQNEQGDWGMQYHNSNPWDKQNQRYPDEPPYGYNGGQNGYHPGGHGGVNLLWSGIKKGAEILL